MSYSLKEFLNLCEAKSSISTFKRELQAYFRVAHKRTSEKNRWGSSWLSDAGSSTDHFYGECLDPAKFVFVSKLDSNEEREYFKELKRGKIRITGKVSTHNFNDYLLGVRLKVERSELDTIVVAAFGENDQQVSSVTCDRNEVLSLLNSLQDKPNPLIIAKAYNWHGTGSAAEIENVVISFAIEK